MLWPERELHVLQGLEDLEMQEDQNAVFVCEISLEDVPGEWFKDGEKITPTSTIKIRQEGHLSNCHFTDHNIFGFLRKSTFHLIQRNMNYDMIE